VRENWERFLSGDAVHGVRAPVADSWRRSLDAQVDPAASRPAPLAADADEASARWEVHPLAEAAALIRDRLASIANESQHLIVVSDADGMLLQLVGDTRVRSLAADSMNFAEGALWSEAGAGTNAIGTALVADHAVQIFAAEHFMEVVQPWTCSAAPVHDPETGELLGVIDLTGLVKDVHPHSLALAISAARAVEAQLRYRRLERDDRLRARYHGQIIGGSDRRALVGPTGGLLTDESRGWLRGADRLELPRGGGELVLPWGARAFAEPVGHEEAFIVRKVGAQRPSRSRPQDDLHRLAEEQAALRRVAALVAAGAPPHEVFTAVTKELGQLLGVSAMHMVRYSPDRTATGVASWSADGRDLPLGTRAHLDGTTAAGLVFMSGRPARKSGYDDASGEMAAVVRELGVRSSVGGPITVDGQLWGALIASSNKDEPLPRDTESRIAAFTELVATAISNTEARVDVARLAEEQAALRHVATLVAEAVPQKELFAAVAEEVGTLLRAEFATMVCYESDRTANAVAAWASVVEHVEPSGRWTLDESDLAATILRTGRAARADEYDGAPGRIAAYLRESFGVTCAVGSPIVVDGRVWGALFVHSTNARPLPPDTESRLESFTELVATAISNAHARAEVRRLADEQAALRRVATLVARESPPAVVFGKVAEEVGLLVGADAAWMHCHMPDGSARIVASWGSLDGFPVGTRLDLDGESVAAVVARTQRPARVDYAAASGALAASLHGLGIRAGVGSPIVVDGHLWGGIVAATMRPEPMPADAESRIGEFTELVATAISNVQARADLAASRARIVAATDEERRRVVRDLHDGAQQRMVHTIVTLKLARRSLHRDRELTRTQLSEALEQEERAMVELRELAHGILPDVLTRGGLNAAVDSLASRTTVPVENGVSVDRLPSALEATAYFVVAEALTNVAKHAHARRAQVTVLVADDTLQVRVRDDGVGGARADGSGFQGLADRLAVLEGSLQVESPANGGTLVEATIPVPR